MCQLLGLSFIQNTDPGEYLSAFVSRSRLNPDGWGLACYPGECNNAVVFKEPIAGHSSSLVKFLYDYQGLRSKTFVGHIRKTTRGGLTYENTHPFNRCYGGREYTFCHNGTLYIREKLNRLTYTPMGETDSELAFCYLLSQLSHFEIKPVVAGMFIGCTDMDFQIIYEILADINVRTAGIFNCVFSDGQYLFCYRDLSEARNLFYTEAKFNLRKNGTAKKFPTQFLTIENPELNTGYVIATEPLYAGNWKSFTAGNLIVFKDGEIVTNLS